MARKFTDQEIEELNELDKIPVTVRKTTNGTVPLDWHRLRCSFAYTRHLRDTCHFHCKQIERPIFLWSGKRPKRKSKVWACSDELFQWLTKKGFPTYATK